MPKLKKDGTRKTKEEYTKTDWIEYLWPTFSWYIRMRDCLATTGTTTHGICCTCGKRKRISGQGQLQAGHFIPGRTDAILFDEYQVHAQCYRCNNLLQGMWHKYYIFMCHKHGCSHEDIIDMIEHSEDPVNFVPEWYEQTKEYYEQEIARLTGKV